MQTATLNLLPVRKDDENLLFEVYASTRTDEMSQTGWDEARKRDFLLLQFAAQQQHYRSSFPQGDHRLIVKDGSPVGRIYTVRTEQEIRILDIALLPHHR
ncbi:MAG TPA: GNAT family N-acetyltransferase, partial [Blastocatellia bacterium]